MTKVAKHLFPIFLVLITILVLIPNSTIALSYYNWVELPDFTQAVNVAEDGSFESGSFNSGVTYGNFSGVGTTSIKTINPYHGVYHVENTQGLMYNFTYPEEILGSDVDVFYFWMDCSRAGANIDIKIIIYYSDNTTSSDVKTINQGWKKIDILTVFPNLINPIKYIVAFNFHWDVTGWYDIDYVIFRTGLIGGQNVIDYDSYPWFCTGSVPLDIGLDTAVGHYEIGSGYIGGSDYSGELIQNIPYVDSDYIHYFDLWVYSTVVSDIKLTVIYSDNTYDINYEGIISGDLGNWTHKVFSGFFDSDKYVTQIQIGILNPFSGRINFDDVGLWASVPFSPEYQRFSFIVSPTPIQVFGHQIVCYLTVNYKFYGFLKNSTGEYNENGTFTVTHNLGSTTGIINKGLFNFTIVARTSTISGYEDFGILVILETAIEEFKITIEWRRYGTEDIPTPSEEVPWIATTAGTNFIVMMFMVFVPSTMIGFEFSRHKQNGLLGFMIGLALMSSIAFLSGLMPLWFLFLMLIGFVVYIFFSLKSGV